MLTLPEHAPTSEEDLLARANRLSGRTLGEIAGAIDEEVPPDLRRDKGWVGRLIERCLGADAGNRAAPDFVELDVELKTLPVDSTGSPLETTYVTTVELTDFDDLEFESSTLAHKLRRVLWVPIHAEPDLPHRMIGTSVLWSPDEDELEQIRRDWQWHIRTIRDGYVENIQGSDGEVLQIRPKAANSDAKTWGLDPYGEAIMTMPRGFYLRTSFTEQIIRKRLATSRS